MTTKFNPSQAAAALADAEALKAAAEAAIAANQAVVVPPAPAVQPPAAVAQAEEEPGFLNRAWGGVCGFFGHPAVKAVLAITGCATAGAVGGAAVVYAHQQGRLPLPPTAK